MILLHVGWNWASNPLTIRLSSGLIALMQPDFESESGVSTAETPPHLSYVMY